MKLDKAQSREFKGKVVIVTGGSLGIGKAIVERFAAGGAAVVYCSNDKDSALQTKEELLQHKYTFKPYYADVSSAHDMEKLAQSTVDEFGGIDILVNNAGLQRYGTVETTEEASWDRVMNVNVKGIYLASKYVIPFMRQREGGAIINISSVQARQACTNAAAYVASKGAVNALTQAMALDHAKDKIRVNAVCPGSVDTPMLHWAADLYKGNKTQADVLTQWGRAHPLWDGLQRLCQPEEVAELVIFLAGTHSTYLTGATIPIDGGLGVRLAQKA